MSENPIYHDQKRTYGSYLKVPELLTLQTTVASPSHRDELLFIVAHQVYELWFKQMLHELFGVCDYLDKDEPLRAAQLFERIHKIQHLLIEQIPLLETMFSTDFAKFRDSLRPASGFQSVQFRKIEFLCGNKNPKMLQLVGEDDQARAEMAAFLDKPTPYDHFMRHLAREDDDVFKVPKHFLVRDVRQPHEPDAACIASLVALYHKQDEDNKGERYYAQFRVAEHLLEFDEKFSIWRFHHVKMVERMIGAGMGTGGSSGAKYLASTLQRVYFPDIWQVRDALGSASVASTHAQPPAAPSGGGCPFGGGR